MSHFSTLSSLVTDRLTSNDEMNAEHAFTMICADYLQESSLIPEFQYSFYFKEEPSHHNLKINGFCLNENEDLLSVFITNYNTTSSEINLNLKNVENSFKQLYRVFNYAIRINSVGIPKAHILSELHNLYATKIKDQLIQVNFYLLTNNVTVNRKEIKSNSILSKTDLNSDIDFIFRIFDLNELERLHKNKQELNIEVSEFYDKPITILKPHINNPSYGTAISIFPGEFLFNIYKEFGGRLLESNVRSFLSSNVAVNKGIAATLITNPAMFLAYNNGLCVTVSKIELNTDGSVKEFKNFQIVNGGQTTSSIYFSKKKNKEIHLEYVNVMVKITELKRNIDSIKIQKRIAINSNLQNAVKNSDLTSNEEFLKNLHSSSKKFRNPKLNNYFYFERTRGQYKLERDLGSNINQFTNLYPPNNLIDKSILSILFFCTYKKEITPYIAVQSAEKRYKILNEKMDEENKFLSEHYYIRLVGSFILYDFFHSIYGAGKSSIGSIRKNVIAYSISLIQSNLLKSDKSIDFGEIWKNGMPVGSSGKIKKYLTYINKLLLNNLNDGRLDEACKKEESWKVILKRAELDELKNVIACLPICKFKDDVSNKVELENAISNKHELMIDEMNSKINSIDRYKNLIRRIEDEIAANSADGMSLYNRTHESLIRKHFRPNTNMTKIDPISYKLYLLECQAVNGTIIKKKSLEMIIQIEELSRVFEAILKDELLSL